MKRLLILRHAKSDWGADYVDDHERPLNKRGRAAAATIGRYLTALDLVPDRVISSSAVRARDTVRRAIEAGSWQTEVQITRELYEAGPDEWLTVVRGCPDDAGSLLTAGHEPTLSLVVGELIGRARVRFPTAALACIDLDVDLWRDVEFGRGTLRWLVTPKALPALDPS